MYRRVVERVGKKGSVLGCFIALIIGVGAFALLFAVPLLLGYIAAPFLFLPDQLGLLHRGEQEDIVIIPSASRVEYEFELSEPGEYAIFSEFPLDLSAIILESKETGRTFDLNSGTAWFSPHSEEILEGEPIGGFEVDEPGIVGLSVQGISPQQGFALSIVSNDSNRNRIVFFSSCFVQIGVLVLLAGAVYYHRNRQKIRAQRKEKDEKRERFESWLRQESDDSES